MHTGCLSAAPQRFITVQTAFALSLALKYRSIPIVFFPRAAAKLPLRIVIIGYVNLAGRKLCSVNEVNHRSVAPVQKPGELPEVRRRHIVEHGVVISVICHVQRIEAQPHVMTFALRAHKRNLE